MEEKLRLIRCTNEAGGKINVQQNGEELEEEAGTFKYLGFTVEVVEVVETEVTVREKEVDLLTTRFQPVWDGLCH